MMQQKSENLLKSTPRMQQSIKELVHVPNAITLGKYWLCVVNGKVIANALIPTVNEAVYGRDMFSKYSDMVRNLFKQYGEQLTGELKKMEDESFSFFVKNGDEQLRFNMGSFTVNEWGNFWAATNKGVINAFISMPNLNHVVEPKKRKEQFDKMRVDARFILSHLGYVISGKIKTDRMQKRTFQQHHAIYEHEDGTVEKDKIVIFKLPGYLAI